MLEMSGLENIPRCPCVAVHLIELSHDPLSSGYAYDLVPPGQAVMEHDTKTFPTQKVGKLIPNKVPDRHWQVISVDMIGELPDSKGYNAALMVVDHLSKWIHAIPTVTSLDSARVAQCRWDNDML